MTLLPIFILLGTLQLTPNPELSPISISLPLAKKALLSIFIIIPVFLIKL